MTTPDAPSTEAAVRVAIRLCLRHCRAPATAQYDQERLATFDRWLDAGGSIVLEAELDGDESLAISVTNDGIGIDAADLPQVFDRFNRTDQTQTRGAGGPDLALVISRAIVEAHEGKAAMASEGLGHGVSATIRLPLR